MVYFYVYLIYEYIKTLKCMNMKILIQKFFLSRSGYDMSRVMQDAGLNHAKIVIYNVSKEDTGTFVCVASNGIGTSATKPVQLIVKCESGHVKSCHEQLIFSQILEIDAP